MKICVTRLKSLRKDQRKNSVEPDDTTAAPAAESAPDTIKELDPEIATAEQIESLSLSQSIVPYHHLPN